MKRFLNMLVVFALFAGSAAVSAQDTPTQPSKPTTPPTVVPEKAPAPKPVLTPKMPELPALNDILRELFAPPPAPASAELESEYDSHWKRLHDNYVFREKLPELAKLKEKYKGKLTTVDQLHDALKALYKAVDDEWTGFARWDEINLPARGSATAVHMGIGLKLGKDGNYRVRFIGFGTPAHKSVLRERYTITDIADKKLAGLSEDEVNDLLRGEPGTKVTVGYQTEEGLSRHTRITFVKHVADPVVVSVMDGALYVRLPDFINAKHIPTIKTQMRKLYDEAGGKLSGIVLDLRNNGGGHPEKALEMARLFVADGTVMRFRNRNGRFTTVTEHIVEREIDSDRAILGEAGAKYSDFLQKSPMVVLVNGSTASSSEILLAGLQDSGRVKVVGTKTFGKGVAYRYYETLAGMAQITVSHYVRPNGSALHAEGITPDLEVRQPKGGDRQLKVAIQEVKRAAKAK